MRAQSLLTALLLALVACSGDGPTDPPLDPGEQTRTLAFAGGDVEVEGESGASLKVTIPAGALLTPTPITLRAVPATTDIVARFALEPAGLALLAPATFTITLPNSLALEASSGISFERSHRVPVPTTVDLGARTLSVQLSSLGFADPTASKADDAFINVQEFECQLLRDSLANAILRAQAFVGAFPPDLASPLILEYRAALAVCESEGGVAEASALIQQLACDKINSASAHAGSLPAATAADLVEHLGFLLAADALAREAGAECIVAPSDYQSTLDEYITHYTARVQAPEFVADFPTWNALWAEDVRVMEVAGLAESLGAPEMRARVDDELFPALFTRLHEVALEHCDEAGENALLADILTGGHFLGHAIVGAPELPSFSGLSAQTLQRELQLCGSLVFVEALDRSSTRVDQRTFDALTTTNPSPLDTPADGAIRIDGNEIPGFLCGGIVDRLPISMRAERSDASQVVQLGQLGGSTSLTVESITDALGLEVGSQFVVVIDRVGVPCGIPALGAAQTELFRIAVGVTEPAPYVGSGSWSGTCPDEEEGTVQGNGGFTVSITHAGLVSGSFNGSASGGIQGTVAADGTLNASASGSVGSCTWTGTISRSGGQLSGSGSWSCNSGCEGGWSF